MKTVFGVVVILLIGCGSPKKAALSSKNCENDGIYACAFDQKSGNWIRIAQDDGLTRLVTFIDDCNVFDDSLIVKGYIVYSRGLKNADEIPYEGNVEILCVKEKSKKIFEVVQDMGTMDSTGKFSIKIPALKPDVWLIFKKENKLPIAIRFFIK